jgi:hypothetical protein
MAWVICPARVARGGLGSWSAASSSRWPAASHRGGCSWRRTVPRAGPAEAEAEAAHWTLDALAHGSGHPPHLPAATGLVDDGYRIKAPWVYDRGAWKTWVDGALRPGDGQAITVTAPSRDSVGYQQLLAAVEAANPTGEIAVITDNLPSHSSFSTRTWLAGHLRIRQVFIPVGTCG